MAGSRLEHFGTIFTRIQGLIRGGAMKEADRPMWYDLYQAFPPRFNIKNIDKKVLDAPVPPIFYPEDHIRAKFYSEFPNSPVDLLRTGGVYQSLSHRFVNKYLEIQEREPSLDEDSVFKRCIEEMKLFKRRPRQMEEPQDTFPKRTVRVADYLDEKGN